MGEKATEATPLVREAVAEPTGLQVPQDRLVGSWQAAARVPAVGRDGDAENPRCASAGASSGGCSRPVSTSHDVTVLPDTDARVRPSAEKASAPSLRPAFAVRISGSPPAWVRSQSLTVRSRLADASVRPPSRNARSNTMFECPFSVAQASPVSTFHSLIVLVLDAARYGAVGREGHRIGPRRPFGPGVRTPPGWSGPTARPRPNSPPRGIGHRGRRPRRDEALPEPSEGVQHAAGSHVPEPHLLVAARRGDPACRRFEIATPLMCRLSVGLLDRAGLPGLQVPELIVRFVWPETSILPSGEKASPGLSLECPSGSFRLRRSSPVAASQRLMKEPSRPAASNRLPVAKTRPSGERAMRR